MLSTINELTCTVCGETKLFNEFKRNKECKSGRVARCKVCVNEQSKEKYHRDNQNARYKHEISRTPEEIKERKLKYNKEYYLKNLNRLHKYSKKYRQENKEEIIGRRRRYYIENREEIKVASSQYRIDNADKIKQYQIDNKPRRRERWLKRYGIDEHQYHEILEKQYYGCAICGRINGDGRLLAVDHNHQTNEVRGLLCHSCNSGIGLLKDDIDLLFMAIDYLED